MKFLKVQNIKGNFGRIDYKGLDLRKIIGGSQVYEKDLNYCLLATNEEGLPVSTDIIELTETEYTTLRNELEHLQQQEEQTIEDRISLMQQALDDLLLGGM